MAPALVRVLQQGFIRVAYYCGPAGPMAVSQQKGQESGSCSVCEAACFSVSLLTLVKECSSCRIGELADKN